MATDLATLATSSLVNPFAPAHSQLSSLGDQPTAALVAASAGSMLPGVLSQHSGAGSTSKQTFVLRSAASFSPSEALRVSSSMASSNLGANNASASLAASYMTPSALDQHAHRLAAAAAGNLSGWCLFVYNLAPEIEENVIWKLFGPFGAVQQVNLVKDAQTNKCRGFAFVTMSDYNQALMAIQSLNGYMLANRVLQVSFKTSKVRKTMQ